MTILLATIDVHARLSASVIAVEETYQKYSSAHLQKPFLSHADASPELIEQCKIIEKQHHIPVKVVAKDNLMRMTLRGLLKR
jgi:hypothetical protein